MPQANRLNLPSTPMKQQIANKAEWERVAFSTAGGFLHFWL